ncbi:MAG: hypothetical protein AAF902_05455 [Chloroflexota bacterium]
MSNPFTDSFNVIDAEIAAAVQTGDTQKEIETRGAKAAKHLLKFQFKQAAAEIGKVAELVGQKGQTANVATAKFAQSRAYAQMDNGLDVALEKAAEAIQLADQVGDLSLRGDIALFIGKLYTVQEDFVEGYQAFSLAVSSYSLDTTKPEKFIEALRLRAGAGAFIMQFDQADRDFLSALDLARQSGMDDVAAEVENQREALKIFAKGELTADELGNLLEIGSRFGDLQMQIEPNLQKALGKLKQKKFAAAQKLAQKSLDGARQNESTSGYIRYLSASFVLAEIHAAADEKVDVLKVLLRCKVFIEQKFTPAAGLFLDQYLNSFQARWGAEVLQQTIAQYQQWVSENGPVEA